MKEFLGLPCEFKVPRLFEPCFTVFPCHKMELGRKWSRQRPCGILALGGEHLATEPFCQAFVRFPSP